MRKPGLSWGGLVTVRSAENNLHAQVLDAGARFFTAVVRSTIHQYDYIVAPARTELFDEGTSKMA